jgi:osmotically-inducible protein OsmY
LRALRVAPHGVVLLYGEVPDVAAKKLALERVGSLPEVTGIADRLRVAPVVRMSDDEIREHMRRGLLGEPTLRAIEIRELDDGAWQLVRGVPTGAVR